MTKNTLYKLSLLKHEQKGTESIGEYKNLGYYNNWNDMTNSMPLEVEIYMEENAGDVGWKDWKFTKVGPHRIVPSDLQGLDTETIKRVVFAVCIEAKSGWTSYLFYITMESARVWKKERKIRHGLRFFNYNFGAGWWEQLREVGHLAVRSDPGVKKTVNPHKSALQKEQRQKRASSDW